MGKWTHLYATYLSEWLRGKLQWLELTIREVDEGLQQQVKPGDSDALRSVLACIHRVKVQEGAVGTMWQPLKDAAALLKRY